MLRQWRYKIVDRFGRYGRDIYRGSDYLRFKGMRPRPVGCFLYRPSRRRYDYVDYTGKFKGVEVDISDTTWLLEVLGLIKFVERVDCEQGSFTE